MWARSTAKSGAIRSTGCSATTRRPPSTLRAWTFRRSPQDIIPRREPMERAFAEATSSTSTWTESGIVDGGKGTLEDPGDRRVIGNSSPRYQYEAHAQPFVVRIRPLGVHAGHRPARLVSRRGQPALLGAVQPSLCDLHSEKFYESGVERGAIPTPISRAPAPTRRSIRRRARPTTPTTVTCKIWPTAV